MTEPFTFLGIFVIAFFLFIVYTHYTAVHKASSLKLEPVSYEPTQNDVMLSNQYGFEISGVYEFVAGPQRVTVFGYQQPEKSIYMYREIMQFKSGFTGRIEFYTEFSSGYSLITSPSSQLANCPFRPGTYGQSFPKKDLQMLWQKHLDAQNYLIKFGSVRLVSEPLPFKDVYENALRQQANYIRSFFCWPLMGIYGFLVRRHFWKSKTIELQHQTHMIKLPNEISV